MATRDAMLGVVCVAALAGAASAQPRPAEPTDDAPRPPSYAIYPTQRIPLRFDHRRHLSLPGVTCEGCHSRAARMSCTSTG